jgi:hypothetical protein
MPTNNIEMVQRGRVSGFEQRLNLDGNAVYEFKFIIDGEWRCSPDYPTKYDADGNENNVLDLASMDAIGMDCLSIPACMPGSRTGAVPVTGPHFEPIVFQFRPKSVKRFTRVCVAGQCIHFTPAHVHCCAHACAIWHSSNPHIHIFAYCTGSFNQWSTTLLQMTHTGDGVYALTLLMRRGKRYAYQFVVTNGDGKTWHTDPRALLHPDTTPFKNSLIDLTRSIEYAVGVAEVCALLGALLARTEEVKGNAEQARVLVDSLCDSALIVASSDLAAISERRDELRHDCYYGWAPGRHQGTPTMRRGLER